MFGARDRGRLTVPVDLSALPAGVIAKAVLAGVPVAGWRLLLNGRKFLEQVGLLIQQFELW